MSNTSTYRVDDTGGVTEKVDIIRGAYSQLRISGLTRSPTPEDLELALTRLENMAAEWDTVNDTGYNFEDTPNPNSVSGIMRGFRQCYETNLAVRLIPDFNKDPPATLLSQAVQSLSRMIGLLAAQRIRQTPYPDRQPLGSGNTYRYSRWARFYRSSDAPLADSSSSIYDGDVRDYKEHYSAYLQDGEEIETYSIVVDSGLVLVDDSISEETISYRLRGDASTESVSQVTIIVETGTGRIETRRKYITVIPVSS